MITDNKVGYNDREICVTYATHEQMIERFEKITKTLMNDLAAMGNKQKISSTRMDEFGGKYRIIYTITPTE